MPGLYGSSGKGLVEFKGWLAKGDYRVSSISASGTSVDLHVPNRAPLVESFSYDFARFVCAACESTRGIEADGEFPKATAWAAIRFYYSAFFAAHAILRYFGVSCSQIDFEQSAKVNEFANSIYQIQNRMQSGFYAARFNSISSDVTLSKYGDSHKDTWRTFKDVIASVRDSVISGSGLASDKLKVSQLMDDLCQAISAEGASSGNWLSQYRNAINYRQAFDVWYPYKKTSIEFGAVAKYTAGWKGEVNPSLALYESDRRMRFFGVCAVIMCLMKSLAADLSKNSARSSIHSTRTARLIGM